MNCTLDQTFLMHAQIAGPCQRSWILIYPGMTWSKLYYTQKIPRKRLLLDNTYNPCSTLCRGSNLLMCKQASVHFLNPTKTPPKERHPAHMAYMYISWLTTMTHKLTLNPCQIYKVALRKEKQVLALKQWSRCWSVLFSPPATDRLN
jgi:hypothetical protein